jgi:hypothetical protein
MGATPSLPNFKINFSSSCCNEAKEDKKSQQDLVQPKTPGWLRRSFKIAGSNTKIKKEDAKVVKRTTRVQFAQTDEEKVSNKSV